MIEFPIEYFPAPMKEFIDECVNKEALIQDYLDKYSEQLLFEIRSLKALVFSTGNFSIYELMYPYYNRWGGEILNPKLDIPDESDEELPTDDLGVEELDF